ncbi:flavoprotein, HI0933 family [Desulfitobacterium dichloroeliminans LMG P-21439]|uniref:Flavoprotein, HI0933 family n=1 Tax=Desulfitobacterium dichloroeliminans (strain LMG P-21439 / DCA1) TaxID=871963 RepID=L0FA01_DESDL|nr:NAD(P)/FAD-dependent oxidoreductase [Desulfitobacterium dichloroeliminans]AGA69778.1 flavoprotein, HI0933 family [Desulfitobacterium dichloroeliminans LMG P-21439]
MKKERVIVIGAGAAGLMAAGQAALAGAEVIVLEKKGRPGRKIAISGKGRCNLTNAENMGNVIENYPGNGRFLHGILREFDNVRLREFFAYYGVETKVERGGRVFPLSDDAEQIVEALLKYIMDAGVELATEQTVEEVLLQEGEVRGVRLSNGKIIEGKSVIICTGGGSYPATGSNGDGYRMARKLGHKVITPRPSLVPMRTYEDWVTQVQGLALRNVEASLWYGEKKQKTEFGEMLFTHFGVSGPIILTLSRWAGEALAKGNKVQLTINLKPALTSEQLDQRVQRDFKKFLNKQFKNSLDEMLPKSLIPVIIQLSEIPPERAVNSISREERKRLVQLLQVLPLTITETLPLAAAIVTAGGVDVKEIDPKTMASKKVQGIFWAGEVVDVDGVTGGYNLQAAFAMGYRAGRAAGEYVLTYQNA